ncbi:methyl-accepting chemotaxis protein [Pseudoalteromonas phenolica]|uniref:Methyl-accepting chemotaxis protein n=1 Tax=Pseudoalteromonas phenolica TaxID=161398 RepID=A0A5S3YTQ3_9GAMM|nr:methyl-accepting chemotaxis protein [Pseudoalteromonas phenolica]TMP80551.1 methyl-accepting chemotaxis protein [Pseudoalteromonas phenolica]
MDQRSIKIKLIAFISVTLILLITSLVTISWLQLNSNNQVQSERVQNVVLNEINGRLMAKARLYSEQVSAYINKEYQIPYSLAGGIAKTAEQEPISRRSLYLMMLGALEKNQGISSIYAQFEANGYDGKDSQFGRSGQTHSVPGAGSLEIYITRDAPGQFTQHQIEDPSEKYLNARNEFGFRESEWYLCAKDNLKPCIMEPYLYEITPGNSELMTSLTTPVIANNRFIGLVGVDINLPRFQTLTEEVSKSLYNGQAKISILSDIGLLVGSSHYDKLARPLLESLPGNAGKTIMDNRKRQAEFEIGDNLVFTMPIDIKVANTTWSLVIELPKALALEQAYLLAMQQAKDTSSVGSSMILTGVIATIIALTLSLIILKTIIDPLTAIKNRVENLASNNGDLTVQLDVTQHEELIAIATGFNLFTQKLRNMVNDLKGLANNSYEQSTKTSQAAEDIKAKVNMQHMEIDSVVTAINELSATASEVARSSENAASSTNETNKKVKASERGISAASSSVQVMSEQIANAKESINAVAIRSNDITQILDVIRAIAEQTNLLALNAAIEAARAGEQGRGFAVVADEVRSLASKTQDSTNEISQLIDNLQTEVKTSEDIIEHSVVKAHDAMTHCGSAAAQMSEMVAALDDISNEVTQIATAAEQQSAVTEDLSANMTGISDAAAELAQLADTIEDAAQHLMKLVEHKNSQLGLLRT